MQFAIFEDNVLVAMDIEQVIQDHFPAARVTVFSAPLAEARQSLSVDDETLIIAAPSYDPTEIFDFCRGAAKGGAKILMIGSARVGQTEFDYIDKPFSTDLLLEAIERTTATRREIT